MRSKTPSKFLITLLISMLVFTYTPPGNGAFICKNSWGTSSGEGGYFYVS